MLNNKIMLSCLYMLSIITFSVGLFIVSPTMTSKIMSIIILLLFFLAFKKIPNFNTYGIMATVLILHHALLFTIEGYHSIDPGPLTPFVIFSGLLYAPVLSDLFTPVIATLTLTYHFWSYNIGSSFFVAGIKTFNAILISILITTGVHLFQILSAERDLFYKTSIIDPLTGLYNFTHSIKLGQELIAAGRNISVVLIDIDDFKDINDTYGHFAGNNVLLQFSKALKDIVGPDGVVARLGGDEFLIILQQDKQSDEQMIELLDELKYKNYITDPELVPVTLSFSYGIAVQDIKGLATIEQLMKVADKSMYRNKLSRKSSLMSYDFDRVIPEDFRDILNVLSQKDMYTLVHSLYVAQYGAMLAEKVGMDAKEVHNIRLAGWLHDLGKIAIPNEILRKPAYLSDEEYTLMKNHVAYGLGLVQSFGLHENILQAIAEHHEKFDGSGYPSGHAQEQIPMGGRILAITDSYSAMTIKRVYRTHQLSKKEALQELILQKGRQFDPKLVDQFVTLLENELDPVADISMG